MCIVAYVGTVSKASWEMTQLLVMGAAGEIRHHLTSPNCVNDVPDRVVRALRNKALLLHRADVVIRQWQVSGHAIGIAVLVPL